MKKNLLILFLVMLSVSLFGRWVETNQENSLFSCDQQTRSNASVEFKLDGFELSETVYSGETYTKITHEEAGQLLEVGMPDLPTFSKALVIPDQGTASIEIISYKETRYENILLYPQEELQYEHEAPKDNFTINSEFYSSRGVYPQQIAWLGDPAVMRDIRVVPVTFCPFQYNAADRSLTVYTEIEVAVDVSGTGGINCKTRSSSKRSRSFENMYRSTTLNYDQIALRDEYQVPTILFICNDDDDVLLYLDYLVEWKRQKGFNVEIATTSETGTTNTAIKNYIQDAYDNWENPPEFVNIMGDGSGSYTIPTWYTSGGYGEGDHPYSQLEGNDILGDVILGRMTFSSISVLQTVISKVLLYEKTPYMGDTDWYSRILLTGDPSHSEYSTITVCKALKELALDYPGNFWDDDNFEEVYQSPFPSQMNAAINLGVSFYTYRGYLGMSSWSPGSTSNGYMMPFACIPTCGSNNWQSGTGKAEGFYLQGSTSLPGGGVAAVGTATSSTHTPFNNAFCLGTWGGVFRDDIFTAGGAVLQGKYYLWLTFPQFSTGYVVSFSHWNTLMGDGSVELWTRVPQTMNAIYEDVIPSGSNYYQVVVTDSISNAAEGAWVTLKEDGGDYVSSTFCDVSGSAILDIDGAPDGDYILTITKHDHIPISEEVTIEQVEQFVDLTEVTYDDASGNGNGNVNPGETVSVMLTIENLGSSAVSDVVISMESNNDLVTVNTTEITAGDLAAGESLELATGFELEFAPSLLGGVETVMDVIINDGDGNQWRTWLNIPIEGANLYPSDYTISGDGVIDPGETADIYFTLTNNGNFQAEDVQGVLTCNNSRITINDDLGDFGTIDEGDTGNNATNRFGITASTAILPGTHIPFIIHLTNANGYDAYVTMNVAIGEPTVADPYGPDEYGYWCYDDGDTDYDKCPDYDWVEIDPAYDGDGESCSWETTTGWGMGTGGDEGTYDNIELPGDFTFVFYGEEYDDLCIATSGWIAPGYHETGSFMNYPIPGPQGPSPMIAAFWDDLSVSSGGVYYYYDDDLHYFVVQWSRIQNGDTGASETFQIILYDPIYYPTTTGDSEIKFQYMDVTNNNSGSYPSNHGQFCTVGIENEDSMIGLNYTFNDTYPEACKELTDNMAILFTPPPIPPDGPFINIASFTAFAGDDLFIESGETAVLSMVLENMGAEAANNLTFDIATTDPYVTITDNTESVTIVPAGELVALEDAFTIEISENVPDFHIFYIESIITSDEDSWNWMLPYTAYHPNTFEVDQDSIYYELLPGATGSQEFTLSNIGDLPVNFYIRTDETTENGRSIEGSQVTIDTDSFTPGEEATWTFTVYNGSMDSEWLTDVWIDFPLGVSVLDADDAEGGSGGPLVWDGTTGPGEIVNWHGETANGWGVIRDGEYASWEVDVLLSTEFAGDMTIGWEVGGDGYGAEPHNVTGELYLLYPLRWINLDTSSGTMASGESQVVTINYDSNDIEEGVYTGDIVITCDSWDTKVINIILEVQSESEGNNEIKPAVTLSANYPNPFNPETDIAFEITENSSVNLSIYNSKGQLVKTLANSYFPAGKHQLTWRGYDQAGNKVGSGVYFYKLQTAGKTLSRKMVLIK